MRAMPRIRTFFPAWAVAAAACGAPDTGGTSGDAAPVPDMGGTADGAPDMAPDMGGTSDAATGFGAISGMCGVLDTELTDASPHWVEGEIVFAERYEDPEDRDRLTAEGLEVLLDGNAGGSSVYSEVFAMEVLARCELAALLKTETEIVYDTEGKKADLLVSIDGAPIGVSVTRAVTYPFGTPYTFDAASELIDRKLDDILLARDAATAADRWDKSMLATLAYDAQHAAVFMDAWNAQDAATRADTIVLVFVTSGDDLFIYTDQ